MGGGENSKVLNVLLKDVGRNTECLQYVSGEGSWMSFKSEHSSLAVTLEHLFFQFV